MESRAITPGAAAVTVSLASTFTPSTTRSVTLSAWFRSWTSVPAASDRVPEPVFSDVSSFCQRLAFS